MPFVGAQVISEREKKACYGNGMNVAGRLTLKSFHDALRWRGNEMSCCEREACPSCCNIRLGPLLAVFSYTLFFFDRQILFRDEKVSLGIIVRENMKANAVPNSCLTAEGENSCMKRSPPFPLSI